MAAFGEISHKNRRTVESSQIFPTNWNLKTLHQHFLQNLEPFGSEERYALW